VAQLKKEKKKKGKLNKPVIKPKMQTVK